MTLNSEINSNNSVNIICRKVSQNNVDFLVGSIKARDLLNLVSVTHRAIIGFDEDGFPIYNDKIQRKPSPTRVNSIKNYLLTDKFATFPNNILVSIPSIVLNQEISFNSICDTYTISIDQSKIRLNDESSPLYLQVFDGQHRFRGIQEAIKECQTNNEFNMAESFLDFEFVVSFFIDAEIDFQAMLFSVINRTPVKVTQDLVYDLFGLTENDSPQKTALAIALELNGTPTNEDGTYSPFYKRIRLLAKKEKEYNSPLSQGMFVKEITKLISPSIKEAEVERFHNRDQFSSGGNDNTIFRKSYSENKDFVIYRTLLNYFNAVQKSFIDKNGKSYWTFSESEDNPLQRTIGFQALIKILIILFPEGYSKKDLSEEYFCEKLRNMSQLQLVDENGKSKYEYSSVGINKLKEDIIKNLC
jgi:DGQHR domain-containing protein